MVISKDTGGCGAGWPSNGYCTTVLKQTIQDARYQGTGYFCLTENSMNPNSGDVVDPRLASALKVSRILDELIAKQRLFPEYEGDQGIRNLWHTATRIAESDCNVRQTEGLRKAVVIPGRAEQILIRANIRKYMNVRGEELRRVRLRRIHNQKRDELLRDPSQAFAYLKPDADPPLASLKRDDGTFTGNITEMDATLREKWGSIFCKHNEDDPPPETYPFMEIFSRFIEEYLMEWDRIDVLDFRSTTQQMQRLWSYGVGRVVTERLQETPAWKFGVSLCLLRNNGKDGEMARRPHTCSCVKNSPKRRLRASESTVEFSITSCVKAMGGGPV